MPPFRGGDPGSNPGTSTKYSFFARFLKINAGEKTLNRSAIVWSMYDLLQDYFNDFEEASKLTQILIGISLSILMTLISRLILRGPVMKVI